MNVNYLTITLLIFSFVVLGCTSKKLQKPTDSKLKIVDSFLTNSIWNDLKRFPARYPFHAAKKSLSGCATISYTVSPNYKIESIKTVDFSDKIFISNAKTVITKWNWTQLKPNIIANSLRTQTRFNFCIETGNNSCDSMIKKMKCSGADSINSIGTMVKRAR